jgi:EAL and modified HD-GYP domain-containing signal transduction protein
MKSLAGGAEASSTPTVERVVARQPIVGVDDQIVGFQLLHRSSAACTSVAPVVAGLADWDADSLSDLMDDLLVDIDRLIGHVLLFADATTAVLVGEPPVLGPSRAVLEVPAFLYADPAVVERCRALVEEGYSIALDRYRAHEGHDPLLEIADFVKVDLGGCSREQVLATVRSCRGTDVTLVASRCMTEDDLVWGTEVGFELFQGPAVQHPVEVSNTLAPSAFAQVQLASELLDETLDYKRVEELVCHEPALVVAVLHYASLGAGGGLRRRVRSVREALVLLGTRRLQQWAALTILGRQVSSTRTDALAFALVRARMAEMLAPSRSLDPGFAFTAGLLSALDRLLGVEIEEVESRVDVDEALAAAAFRRETPVGELVGLIADYQDDVDAGGQGATALGDIGLVAALSFGWAMTHVIAIETTPLAA